MHEIDSHSVIHEGKNEARAERKAEDTKERDEIANLSVTSYTNDPNQSRRQR